MDRRNCEHDWILVEAWAPELGDFAFWQCMTCGAQVDVEG
jgi:hypothetical protein